MPSMKKLTSDLASEIKAGSVEVNLEPRGLVVSLKQTAFFPSGTDAIDPSTYPDSRESRRGAERRVESLAHRRSHRFRSHPHRPFPQQLGAIRRAQHFDDGSDGGRFNVDRQRVAIVGFADTAPQTSNDTRGRPRAQPPRGYRDSE